MSFLFNIISILVFTLACLFSAGCTSEDSQPPGPQIEDITGTRQPIIYRLKWLYNASVAGDIWALHSGIFRNHGLRVQLQEGGPEQDAIKDLELGRAHFGVASADQVIRAAAKGARVIVLAQIFQVNPLQWIYSGSSRVIRTPDDLKGLCIGITYGGNDETIMMALLKKHGISLDQIRLYAVHYDFNPFWKGKVDLWPVYRNTQGIVLQEKMDRGGHEAMFFDPNTHGISFVANSIITSRKIYLNNPELVKKFTRAAIEGWTDAMDPLNADQVALAVHRFAPDTPVDMISRQLDATRSLVAPEHRKKIGSVDRQAWQQTKDILVSQGLIQRPPDLETILKTPPYDMACGTGK
ncbi:MAG TPA: nitrate ABC transporter substrate-binding protein [Thermodesulfobacteriaceae bacterium]|nr:nitrate ABC transporter substrate-binding protein [Thermodesulfobacteriaceae bacterium]